MKTSPKLGTFAGVFTPSILTILGIILFLRLGYIVGTAGIYQSLIIVFLANAISVLSSLSLAAIATNLNVKGGGDYYLISRTLGYEFGGAIGIVLFLAQAVSIAFYCLGFAEVLATILPEQLMRDKQLMAAFAVVMLFGFAWLGNDWASRFQFLVMIAITLALLAFFQGAVRHWEVNIFTDNLFPVDDSVRFWVMFALFFPAVTGFTQGVSMSGDLKDPGRSIPLGTFSAVFLSIVVYFLAVLLYAGSISKTELISVPNPMTRVAGSELFIIAGVISATLSSAMASFMGAPRILQSLAKDRLWKILLPFAEGVGAGNNPRRGVLLSAVIALLTVWLGQLNMIAPIVSMFFLISYGLINFATYFEASTGSPSFRPVFRGFNKYLSLLGALLCLGAMLAVNIIAGSIALSILTAIYFYLRNTGMRSRWADGWRSFHLFRVREHLLAADKEPEHPRDWRPNILLFPIHDPGRDMLYQFAGLLETQSGFTTVVRIVLGKGAELISRKQKLEKKLQLELKQQNLQAFPLTLTASTIDTGIHTLLQAYGIGPLRANTVLLPWPIINGQQTIRPGHSYAHHLQIAIRLQCNLIIFVEPSGKPINNNFNNSHTRIDIWWSGGASSHLALLLAYLVQQNENWEDCGLNLLCVPFQQKPVDLEYLQQHLENIRIPATIKQVAAITPETITSESTNADMIFLPFRLRKEKFLTINGSPLAELLTNLPLTALVLANRDFDLESEPESGVVAEMAEIQDTLDDARDLCDYFQKQMEKLQREKKQLLLEDAEKSTERLSELEQLLEKIGRRKAKAEAKLLLAEKRAENLKN